MAKARRGLEPDRKKLIDTLVTEATVEGKAGGVARIVVGRHAQFESVLAGKAAFEDRSEGTKAEQLARLDAVGLDRVAEYVAQGALPFECAKHLGVSAMVFREWWGSLPSYTVREALASFAEAAMVKAELTLSVAPASKEDAVVQVALAGHFQTLAQATDPSRWNPGKAKPHEAPPAPILLSPNMPGLHRILGQAPGEFDAPLAVEHAPPVPAEVQQAARVRRRVLDEGGYDG